MIPNPKHPSFKTIIPKDAYVGGELEAKNGGVLNPERRTPNAEP